MSVRASIVRDAGDVQDIWGWMINRQVPGDGGGFPAALFCRKTP